MMKGEAQPRSSQPTGKDNAMNRLTLAALGLATALMVSGPALQMAPAHAATTQATTTVKTNVVQQDPVKKKKKIVKHHTKQPMKHASKTKKKIPTT